jgi:hypothetical protein
MTDLETLRQALREQEESGWRGGEPLDVGAVITQGRRLRWRRRAVAVAGGVCVAAAVFGTVTGISQLARPSPSPAPHPANVAQHRASPARHRASPARHPASTARSVPGPSLSRAPGQPTPSPAGTGTPAPTPTQTPALTPTPTPTPTVSSVGSAGRQSTVTPSASPSASVGTSGPRGAIPSPTATR